jgi:hypothetical protein
VTHPNPEFFKNGGTRSSIVAEHRTWVSPHLIKHDPSAWRITAVSIEIFRISSRFLPEGRINISL